MMRHLIMFLMVTAKYMHTSPLCIACGVNGTLPEGLETEPLERSEVQVGFMVQKNWCRARFFEHLLSSNWPGNKHHKMLNHRKVKHRGRKKKSGIFPFQVKKLYSWAFLSASGNRFHFYKRFKLWTNNKHWTDNLVMLICPNFTSALLSVLVKHSNAYGVL